MDFFSLKTSWIFTPTIQIFLIVILFIAIVLTQYREYKKTGKMYKYYPVRVSLFFVPIYEEIIFRGFILSGLLALYSTFMAVFISSILFGLWHIKNIFYVPKNQVIYQMLYTGLIFGPITAYITIISGTIWIAVIVHQLNNLLAPYSQKYFNIKQ